MSKVHGTQCNFRQILEEQRPKAIHFSGGGITDAEIKQQNEEKMTMTQEEITRIYKKGHALLLEDKDYLYADELQKMLKS